MNFNLPLPGNGLKGVLLDLDGTVLDSMPWHIKAWQEILGSLGVEVADEFLYLNEGAIEHSHFKETLAQCGLSTDRELMDRLFSRQIELFNTSYSARVKPYPDAAPVLDRLAAKGLRLGLITSSSSEVVARVAGEELLGRFEAVVTGDKVTRGKPHPEPYLTGLEMLGLKAGQVVAVENAPAGIRSALAAGLTCLALSTTLSPLHLREADRVFGSLTEMAHSLVPV
jgi:beta-phosphoglucomutase